MGHTRGEPAGSSARSRRTTRSASWSSAAAPRWELAARIAKHLDVQLGDADLRTFADGEVYCRYKDSIRGADVFLVQSTAANGAQAMTPNDSLMELLVMIDAAKGASAHRIIAVGPVVRLLAPGQEVGSARADLRPRRRSVPRGRRRRPRPHDGPALWPGSGLLQQAGRPHDRDADADPVLHRPGIDRRPRDRLPRTRAGSRSRATSPARSASTGRSWRRSAPRTTSATSGYVVGDVEGKTAVLVDDMIDTAGTLRPPRRPSSRRARRA